MSEPEGAELLRGIPQQKPSKNTNVTCPTLAFLHHHSVARLFHAAQHVRWTPVPWQEIRLLPVFSPSHEIGGPTAWSPSVRVGAKPPPCFGGCRPSRRAGELCAWCRPCCQPYQHHQDWRPSRASTASSWFLGLDQSSRTWGS